ncbi:hypothetical protein WKY82_14770 [Gordonia malaquae]|uniref:hypothetical protein n=1 Tax=Gordonia malaquae TaxID=410332 RepID=UPI0030C7877F
MDSLIPVVILLVIFGVPLLQVAMWLFAWNKLRNTPRAELTEFHATARQDGSVPERPDGFGIPAAAPLPQQAFGPGYGHPGPGASTLPGRSLAQSMPQQPMPQRPIPPQQFGRPPMPHPAGPAMVGPPPMGPPPTGSRPMGPHPMGPVNGVPPRMPPPPPSPPPPRVPPTL